MPVMGGLPLRKVIFILKMTPVKESLYLGQIDEQSDVITIEH